MKLEIWSDVMCPFCYIGKRHLEQALAKLPFVKDIEIDWKSYQLNPDYHNLDGEDTFTYLSRSKGMPVNQVRQMTAHVVSMANEAGIKIDFDTNIPANSFNAHRLVHLAAKYGKQDMTEELLFKAHFTEGKNVADKAILSSIGAELGLDTNEVETTLAGNQFAEEVNYDVYESKQLGISGVPFFLMNRKYALSGAQPVEAFEEALTHSYNEWLAENPKNTFQSLNQTDDNSCGPEGCAI